MHSIFPYRFEFGGTHAARNGRPGRRNGWQVEAHEAQHTGYRLHGGDPIRVNSLKGSSQIA